LKGLKALVAKKAKTEKDKVDVKNNLNISIGALMGSMGEAFNARVREDRPPFS
jgi:hypothetical protein